MIRFERRRSLEPKLEKKRRLGLKVPKEFVDRTETEGLHRPVSEPLLRKILRLFPCAVQSEIHKLAAA